MSDPTDPNADLPPQAPIAVDKNGDFERQGTLMLEKESYERVIDGLTIMAEACAHMAQRDKRLRDKLLNIAVRLDYCRLRAVDRARIDDKIKQKQTDLTPNPPMGWFEARKRFRYGAKQAEGGFSQLATCHRGEMLWVQMAHMVKMLADGVVTKPNPAARLILPEHMTRQ